MTKLRTGIGLRWWMCKRCRAKQGQCSHRKPRQAPRSTLVPHVKDHKQRHTQRAAAYDRHRATMLRLFGERGWVVTERGGSMTIVIHGVQDAAWWHPGRGLIRLRGIEPRRAHDPVQGLVILDAYAARLGWQVANGETPWAKKAPWWECSDGGHELPW